MAVMSGARVGSLVLGSSDPERIAGWYQAAFAPGREVVDSVLHLNHGLLIFERRSDVEPTSREPGRIIINIEVDELATLVEHLEALDIDWVRPVEMIPVGLIATLRDADGNLVNLLQLNDS